MGLVVHCGGIRRTRDDLLGLTTPEPTPSWKPVPHYDLTTKIVRALQDHGVAVTHEEYATAGKTDARLFGLLQLAIPNFQTSGVAMSLGLRGSNDKSMAIQAIAAARVFVCDNMAFSGSEGCIILARKHTSGLDLDKVVPHAVDLYLDKAGVFRASIEDMQNYGVSDGHAKELIYDAFTGNKPVLPVRMLNEVGKLYFWDEEQREKFPERTLWSLNNAFTSAVKALPYTQAYNRGVQIGRFFGRVLHGNGNGNGNGHPALEGWETL